MIFTQSKDKSKTVRRLVSTKETRRQQEINKLRSDLKMVEASIPSEASFLYKARTLDELFRINAPAPAFGYVEFAVTITTVVTRDPDTNQAIEFIEEKTYRPWAAYFVRTYPPPPMINKLLMPVADGGVQQWNTKIYQPSAGVSGALVYFDQDIPMLEATIGVGVELGYPSGNSNYGKMAGLYKITEVITNFKDGKEYVEGIVIDYNNGLKANELTWLRIDLIPPWGPVPSAIPMDSAYNVSWQLPTFVPPEIQE